MQGYVVTDKETLQLCTLNMLKRLTAEHTHKAIYRLLLPVVTTSLNNKTTLIRSYMGN